MQMDIRFGFGSFLTSHNSWPTSTNRQPLKPCCSKGNSQQQSGDDNNNNRNSSNSNGRDKFSTDWDQAWSRFRKQGKKTIFSDFSPNKYVTWNPKQSNYPLSEEVDPIKRAERSNLMLWTSPGFTLVGASVIVTVLLVYTILAPIK